MTGGRLVWDSERGPVDDEPKPEKAPPTGDGVVRVRRETGGRGGKAVTTVAGVQASEAELRALAKQLKQLCGVGGGVKDFVIELQGDQRDKVVAFLEARGHVVKRAGG